jgi:hypothetical protein
VWMLPSIASPGMDKIRSTAQAIGAQDFTF